MSQENIKIRLKSLDALRGFDMFWIIGGNGLVLAIMSWLGCSDSMLDFTRSQFEHSGWAGFTFYDLIFPLFVFMSGITIPFSIYSASKNGTSNITLQGRIIKRGFVLILIGLTFSLVKWTAAEIRPYNVLALIGGAYIIGSSFCLYFKKPSEQFAIAIGILLSYHLCFFLNFLPGHQEGLILPGRTFASFIDRHLMECKLFMGVFDPVGPVRIISASVLCIFGCLTGTMIKQQTSANFKFAFKMFCSGCLILLIASAWSYFLPIIKPLWTSSYVLFSLGWSLILLSVFYQIIDVMQWNFMNGLFLPIGMNSITIYVGVRIIDFNYTNLYFFKGLAATLNEPSRILLLAVGLFGFKWIFLYFLYRNKLFLRV